MSNNFNTYCSYFTGKSSHWCEITTSPYKISVPGKNAVFFISRAILHRIAMKIFLSIPTASISWFQRICSWTPVLPTLWAPPFRDGEGALCLRARARELQLSCDLSQQQVWQGIGSFGGQVCVCVALGWEVVMSSGSDCKTKTLTALPAPYSALGCDCVRNSCVLFKEITLVGYKYLNSDREKNFLGTSLPFGSEIDEKLLKITLKASTALL